MPEPVSVGVLGTLGLNGKLFFGQLVNFAIILLIVWRWVYRPLIKTMEERDRKIRDGLKNAEVSERKMSEIAGHAKQMRVNAEKDAERLIDDAKQEAEEKRRAIMEETQRDLDRQLTEARERLKREKQTTLEAARQEMAELVTLALERVTSKTITGEAARRFVDEQINLLDRSA